MGHTTSSYTAATSPLNSGLDSGRSLQTQTHQTMPALPFAAMDMDSEWMTGLEVTEHELPQALIHTLFCSGFTESRR